MTDRTFEDALELAAKQGNVEAAKAILLDMKAARIRSDPNMGMPEPVRLGQEGMPASIKSEVREGFKPYEQVLAGGGSAAATAGHAVGELFGADNKADIQNWRAVSGATPQTQGGNIGGNVLMFGAAPQAAVGTGLRMAGARQLPRWGQVGDMAATQGATAAITTPGDVIDRGIAGVLGSGGAAAPAVVGVGQSGRRAGPLSTAQGRQLGLAEGLRRELGGDVDDLITGLGGQYPTTGIGVRPTAAMLTRNPTLEVLETGSRTRTADQWANFDRMNAQARWRALEDAAGTEAELAQLKGARDAITKGQREAALHNANLSSNPLTGGSPYVQGQDIAPLTNLVDRLKTGEMRPNKDVQTMVAYLEKEIGERVSPEQLYTIRKTLTDGIKGGMGNELTQAARSARPQRMEIIKAIDEALDGMTAGGWSQYLESYKIASPLINSREALLKVRERLTAGRPDGEIPPGMGEKPAPMALGRALERFGTKQFGSKEVDQLIPQHRQLVDSLLADLNTQQGVMVPRSTLGSPTAPYTAAAGRVNQLTNTALDAAGNAVPFVGNPLAASLKGSMARQSEEALARLMQDPQLLAQALREAAASEKLLRGSGRVGAGGSAVVRSRRE